MAVLLSKVQKKGQVTIPLVLREKLGITEGSLVAFTLTEQGILMSPQEVVAAKAMDKIGELLKGEGIALEELIESGREIRGKLIEEIYGLKETEW